MVEGSRRHGSGMGVGGGVVMSVKVVRGKRFESYVWLRRYCFDLVSCRTVIGVRIGMVSEGWKDTVLGDVQMG